VPGDTYRFFALAVYVLGLGGINYQNRIMKKSIVCMVVLLMAGTVTADERLFKKIERKLDRDSLKGLAFAKKLKSKRSTEPDAYYFLSSLYLNKFGAETRLTKRYSALNRAASDAYRSTKYTTKHEYIKSHQKVLINQIAIQIESMRDTFLRYKDYDRSERLAKHYSRLTGKHLPTLDQLDSVKQEKQKEEKLLLQVTLTVDGKYYGMPAGDEDIGPIDFKGEKELLRLINNERVKKGLEPLLWSFDLSRAARYHATDMATQRYFDHNTYDRIDGKLVKIGGTFARIRKFYNLRFVNSENIAAGSKLSKDTYRQWYTSKGHYANMFNKKSKYVGIGVAYNPKSPYKYYWVFCTSR
jgi:hypothetical protein